MAGWAGKELKGIDLGERRLDKRVIALLDALAARQTMSIPSACSRGSDGNYFKGFADGYRFDRGWNRWEIDYRPGGSI